MENNRTVQPDGAKIARLRLDKGWSREELAKRAKCALKTMDNVENGSHVYPYTLGKIAAALGVENASELVSAPTIQVKKEGKMLSFVLTLDFPADDFDESDQLVELVGKLNAIIGSRRGVGVLRVEYASVKVTVEVTEEEAAALLAAFNDGKLKELQIINVEQESSALRIAQGGVAGGNVNVALASGAIVPKMGGTGLTGAAINVAAAAAKTPDPPPGKTE